MQVDPQIGSEIRAEGVMIMMLKVKVAALIVGMVALAGALAVAQAQSGGSKVAAGGSFAGATVSGAPAIRPEAGKNMGLDDILKQLSQHEKRLSNLKVVCEFTERTAANNRVVLSGTGTAWIIPVPGGKIRYDMNCTAQGRRPYQKTNSYDGRARYDFLHEDGAPPVGAIKRERMAYMDGPRFGWNASIYGCRDSEGKTLAEFIERIRNAGGVVVELSEEREDGKPYDVLTIRTSQGVKMNVFWLDRTRAYALKRVIECEGPDDNTIADIREWKEVAPNAYYPSHVVWTGGGGVLEYRAKSIVANDPKFDDAVFTFQWPAGTGVRDELTGKSVVIGAAMPASRPAGAK